MRFGKESEPALTASGELFATGLSPKGKLASANDTRAFYGAPLVAWTTALGAEVYEVQWSKTKVPFKPETDPATRRARDDDAQHLRGAPAHVGHLVLPRARLRLLAADRRAGHVLVRPPADRRQQADLRDRRRHRHDRHDVLPRPGRRLLGQRAFHLGRGRPEGRRRRAEDQAGSRRVPRARSSRASHRAARRCGSSRTTPTGRRSPPPSSCRRRPTGTHTRARPGSRA